MDTVHETWKPVPGYEGHYEASDAGGIRSLDRELLRCGKPYRRRGRVLAKRMAPRGYHAVYLARPGHKRYWRWHAVIALAFLGPRPPKADINHKNGVKTDNRVANLEYCTRTENIMHAFSLGLRRRLVGELGSKAILTEGQVRYIRRMKGVIYQKDLARQFGCAKACIANIHAGRSWKHLA